MVRSEIDDIFASVGGGSSSKGKKVAKDHQIEKKSQKKDSNGKSQKNDVVKTKADGTNEKVKSKDVNGKRKQPETIVDPSKALEEAVAISVKKTHKKRKSGGESNKKLSAEDEDFMDSRGSNRRKTDDGFAIYSEAELKLDQGGDTPLCPFDCDCCY